MEKKVNIKEEGHCLLTTNEQIYLKATQFSFVRTEHVGPVKQACIYEQQGTERHVVLSVTNVYTAAISTDSAPG